MMQRVIRAGMKNLGLILAASLFALSASAFANCERNEAMRCTLPSDVEKMHQIVIEVEKCDTTHQSMPSVRAFIRKVDASVQDDSEREIAALLLPSQAIQNDLRKSGDTWIRIDHDFGRLGHVNILSVFRKGDPKSIAARFDIRITGKFASTEFTHDVGELDTGGQHDIVCVRRL
jgi:hypothetical protein